MVFGCGRHEAVNYGERDSFELRLSCHGAPDLRNLPVDRQHSIPESSRQVVFEPSFQFLAFPARRQHSRAFTNLAQCQHAKMQHIFVLSIDPCPHPRIRWPRPAVFRDHVRIEQIPVHSSIARPGSLSRSTLIPEPASGDCIRNSERVCLRWCGSAGLAACSSRLAAQAVTSMPREAAWAANSRSTSGLTSTKRVILNSV